MGSIAVILLNELGYKVTAVTGKSDKNVQEMLKNLGASNIVPRSNFEGDPKPLSKEIYAGAVDTVGGVALTNVLTMVSIFCIFKLADRMRSIRTTGASKNRDCPPPPPPSSKLF